MKQTFVTTRLWIVRVALFSWLAAIISVGSAQAATVSYTLDNVFLTDGEQMTGSFDWTYTIGDFEDGTGVFTTLVIPWTTVYNFTEGNLNINIEANQIDISGDGNYHDYGLDIKIAFSSPLSPTQPTLIDTDLSAFDCCGNGFHKETFVSGTISPTISSVPIPAALPLFTGGLGLLGLLGWCRKQKVAGA